MLAHPEEFAPLEYRFGGLVVVATLRIEDTVFTSVLAFLRRI